MSFDTIATFAGQQNNNKAELLKARYLALAVSSSVLPVRLDINASSVLSDAEVERLTALEKQAAETAVRALGSLAQINELDHLGGGLDLIPALMLTLAVTDYDRIHYTIEHAHTSIGYYASLATLGYFPAEDVIEGFRRGLDFPGHVSWVPGGTPLCGGRLGVMIPAAVGFAAGLRARGGDDAWMITHCGDAGWISGQALNGFNGADLHDAPITFVMHRNGIQLSGSTASIMDKDPRKIIESLGIIVIDVHSLHDARALYGAYREARQLAASGRPSLIYPTGYRTHGEDIVDVASFGSRYGIAAETRDFAAKNGVPMDTPIWIPGAIMSYRDVQSMLECVFLVNNLAGGAGHHDGHMKGRDINAVCGSSMIRRTPAEADALTALRKLPQRTVHTSARPKPGSPNLSTAATTVALSSLPGPGKMVSARAGTEAAYAAIAGAHPDHMFVVSCDLDVSTKLTKARAFLDASHQFEMSIEEQAAALMANGLALTGSCPQFVVFSTFAAFFEGIAREGFDMWRYQRNLDGANEGLNVAFHLSHVGACTGRDHFSGWGLDWINVAIAYLPYLHRFYAPADARSAALAVTDMAAHYGGHIIGVPRDVLPILSKQDSSEALWDDEAEWLALTTFRTYDNATKAIIAIGAPAFLAEEAAQTLQAEGTPVDVHIVNGLPLPRNAIRNLFARYPAGIVTIEDGLIGNSDSGLRGLAGLVSSAGYGTGVPLRHIGICDPRIAPSAGHSETWEHFNISVPALVGAVSDL